MQAITQASRLRMRELGRISSFWPAETPPYGVLRSALGALCPGAGKTDPTPKGGRGRRVGASGSMAPLAMSPGGTPHGFARARCALSCYPTPSVEKRMGVLGPGGRESQPSVASGTSESRTSLPRPIEAVAGSPSLPVVGVVAPALAVAAVLRALLVSVRLLPTAMVVRDVPGVLLLPAGPRPVKWCSSASASSSPELVQAAASMAVTSSGSGSGSVSALAIDSALM
jgi:hypothetical protein